MRFGIMLLKLSMWTRRKEWLRNIYRQLPRRWRDRVSTLMMERILTRTTFAPLPAVASFGRASDNPAGDGGSSAHSISAGVNVFAYLRGQFGLAESSRLYARALIESGHPVALNNVNLTLPHGFEDHSLDGDTGNNAPHDINLIFINPDHFAAAIESIGECKMTGRYIIACWFWELEKIPDDWLWALTQVDEIMVASTFVERAFRKATDKPILRVPPPINDIADSGLNRKQFGLKEDAFLFLNTFDFNSSWCRKNPLAVISAFREAFPVVRRDVQLLIKSSNGHRYPEQLRKLLDSASSDERILVKDGIVDRSHVRALQRCSDAYISLHRAEGFGLGLAECMALGKPVIGTGWSGNLDFMTPENSCLVDYHLVPVATDEYPHSEGALWAEPDVGHAAVFMRRLVGEPLFAQALGKRAAADIRSMLSPSAAVDAIARRVDEIAVSRGIG